MSNKKANRNFYCVTDKLILKVLWKSKDTRGSREVLNRNNGDRRQTLAFQVIKCTTNPQLNKAAWFWNLSGDPETGLGVNDNVLYYKGSISRQRGKNPWDSLGTNGQLFERKCLKCNSFWIHIPK